MLKKFHTCLVIDKISEGSYTHKIIYEDDLPGRSFTHIHEPDKDTRHIGLLLAYSRRMHEITDSIGRSVLISFDSKSCMTIVDNVDSNGFTLLRAFEDSANTLIITETQYIEILFAIEALLETTIWGGTEC